MNCTPKVRHKTFGVQFNFDTASFAVGIWSELRMSLGSRECQLGEVDSMREEWLGSLVKKWTFFELELITSERLKLPLRRTTERLAASSVMMRMLPRVFFFSSTVP